MTETDEEKGHTRSLLQIGLFILAAFLFASGFVYLTYGMSQDIKALKEGRGTRPYKSAASPSQAGEADTVVLPVQKPDPRFAPLAPQPNGTTVWKIAVAPRTPLIRLNIDASKIHKPMRIRFLTQTSNSPVQQVAHIWAGPNASTQIALPAGKYRVGISTAGKPTSWNPNKADAYFIPENLELTYPGSASDPPTLTLSRGKKPELSGKSGPVAPKSRIPSAKPSAPKTPEPPDSYEGLGRGASDGGTPTYG